MRKNFLLPVVILSLAIFTGCVSKKTTEVQSMNLSSDGIERITVSTTNTPQKEDVILEDHEKIDQVIRKLNSYSLKKITDDNEKGWQYLFNIEKTGEDITLISFMDDKVYVDDSLYQVSDYKTDDFMYLFE